MSLRVVGFSGSLRTGSYNSALLAAANDLAAAAGLELNTFDPGTLPLYNTDLELEPPAPALEWRSAVARADGVLVATPEYNYGLSAATKNAVDWVSRRPGREIFHKPAAIMGASTGMVGTARAQLQLRQTFVFTQTPVMPAPELFVANAAEKFDSDGRLVDEPTRELLAVFLHSFAAWIERMRS